MAKQKVYSYKKEMAISVIIILTGVYLLVWFFSLCMPYLFAKERKKCVAHVTAVEEVENTRGLLTYKVTWNIKKDESGYDKTFETIINSETKDSIKVGDSKEVKTYLPKDKNEYEIFEMNLTIVSKLVLAVMFIGVSIFDIIYRTKQERAKKAATTTAEEVKK